MKKLILASLSGIALLGMAACSDSGTGTDNTQTQSVKPPATEPAPQAPATQPGTDGTGGTMQQQQPGQTQQPAPAQ